METLARGEDTGIMNEPLYRVWITGEERPRPWYKDHAGTLGGRRTHGQARASTGKTFYLNATGLGHATGPGDVSVCLQPAHGRHRLWPLGRLWWRIARPCHRPAPRGRPIPLL